MYNVREKERGKSMNTLNAYICENRVGNMIWRAYIYWIQFYICDGITVVCDFEKLRRLDTRPKKQ